MRKTIAAAVLCAIVPNVAFAAGVCPNTGTLADYAALTFCTYSNGGNSWNFSNFSIGGVAQTGYGADPTLANIKLTLAAVGGGFSMTYSAPSVGTNYFTSALNLDQDVSWTNGVWITGTNITQISNSATIASGNSYESFAKSIMNQQGQTVTPSLNIVFDNVTGTQTVSTAAGSYGGNLSINDRIVFDSKTITNSGTQRSGTITSYTNTFGAVPTPVNVVPEPATVALMAAGLLGLGMVSRRRRA